MSEPQYKIDIFLGHIELQQQYRELPNGNLTTFSRSIKVHRDGRREYGEWWQTGAEISGPWKRTTDQLGIAVEMQPKHPSLISRIMSFLFPA